MRIEKPRSPQLATVVIRGKPVQRPKVGYAQHAMLGLLLKLGRSEEPKRGTLTPTGVLREHILNDMIPLGWVTARVVRPGITDYLITALGRMAHKDGIVQDAPTVNKLRKDGRNTAVKSTSPLLARQRARHAAKRGARDTGRTQRRAAAG